MAWSFAQIRDALATALDDKWPQMTCWVRDIFADYFIMQCGWDDCRYYKVPYAIDEATGEATLSEMLEVRQMIDYMPIDEAVQLTEAADVDGWQWRIVLIQPGLSKNGYYYSADTLKTSAALFEGVRCLSRSDAEHLQNAGKSVVNVCGWYDQVQYVDDVGLTGVLHITKDADWLRLKIRSAWDQGKADLVQFSIVASGAGRRQLIDGRLQTIVDTIEHVDSVDTVVDASAGGRVFSLIAGVNPQHQKEMNMLKTLLELLEAQRPDLFAKLDKNNVTEEQVTALLREAVISLPVVIPPVVTAPPVGTAPVVVPPRVAPLSVVLPSVTGQQDQSQHLQMFEATLRTYTEAMQQQAQVATQALEAATQASQRSQEAALAAERRIQLSEARTLLTDTLGNSDLPGAARTRVRNQLQALLETGTVITLAQITEAMTSEHAYLTSLHTTGVVTGFGPDVAGSFQVGESAEDKLKTKLDAFFEKKHHSFRECYVELTGDTRVTGRLSEAVNLGRFRGMLRESLDTSIFDQVFADAMNRQLVREYARLNLGLWRDICDVVPASDFRTRHRIRVGGYANLEIVTQGNPYPSLVSPTDEEATYAVNKRGGTEDLTLEMIRNDDVASIRLIPVRMARAAVQTLHEFVFDFLRTNPTIYDGVALFHNNHGNLTAVAYSATQFMTHRLGMRQQTEMDSDKPLGLLPRVLVGPNTLEEAMYNSFRQDTNMAPRLVQTNEVRPKIVIVDYWTDVNNWYTVASIDQTPLIELAFLDGNEDPEILVQDMPNVGSMFTNDKRTYKIRHVYGGAVVDYRGFQGAVVA